MLRSLLGWDSRILPLSWQIAVRLRYAAQLFSHVWFLSYIQPPLLFPAPDEMFGHDIAKGSS
nr:MAG TPA: hypothetical protein [Caudoviricetes sp.]